jgi:hypothetical protein
MTLMEIRARCRRREQGGIHPPDEARKAYERAFPNGRSRSSRLRYHGRVVTGVREMS